MNLNLLTEGNFSVKKSENENESESETNYFTGKLSEYYASHLGEPLLLTNKSQIDITVNSFQNKEEKKDDTFVIIQEGGVGDTICSTAMINNAKSYLKKKIVVASTHPYIHENNPNIDELYHLGVPDDLYEEHIKNLTNFGSLIKRNLYSESGHKLFPGPLSMLWCYMYKVPWTDDIKIYFTGEEEKEAIKFLASFSKPVVIIQPYSARSVYENKKFTDIKDWIDEYWCSLIFDIKRMGFSVVQIGGQNEQVLDGAISLIGTTSIRQSAAIIKHALTFISIDSLANHIGPAVNKKGVVLFGRSNPFIMGHRTNANIYKTDSCENIFCGRPEGYFNDSVMVDGKYESWSCIDKKCMKSITPNIVLDVFVKVVKELLPSYEKPIYTKGKNNDRKTG